MTPSSPSRPFRAAIITALPLESEAVLAHLSEVREDVHVAGTIYRVGRFEGTEGVWEVAVVIAGMHNVQAAIETERVIAHFNPDILLFSGVAGGLKDVAVGDVVAATKVYWYEAGKDEQVFNARPEVSESSYALVQRAMVVAAGRKWIARAKLAAAGSPPTAFVKPIAAGAKVVASHQAESFRLLRSTFSDAVAVDMESYGFLRAIYSRQGVLALAVRGISDVVEGKEQADAAGNQPKAAAHSAAFALQVLAEFSPHRPSITVGSQGHHGAPPQNDLPALEQLVVTLYPRGPVEREVWSRAGGDVAQLQVTGAGHADWHSALRLLRHGGGGANITPERLVAVMRSDFPNHPELA